MEVCVLVLEGRVMEQVTISLSTMGGTALGKSCTNAFQLFHKQYIIVLHTS